MTWLMVAASLNVVAAMFNLWVGLHHYLWWYRGKHVLPWNTFGRALIRVFML